MRAVHQAGWGGREQLSVRDLPRPSPAVGCVLVRVMAVSVHAGDHHMLTGRPYLVRLVGRSNEIPGMDFSGVVVETGDDVDVERLAVGDQVFGTTDAKLGAFAEYVCVPASHVARKPKNVGWEEAASIPTSGQTALQALRVGGEVRAGHRVLINGASGGVGTFAVQLAKSCGAHVTAVCSTPNVELVKSLGADEVIDYTKQSIEGHTAAAGGGGGGVKYEKIIDAVGRYQWRHLLSSHGVLVAVALPDSESECIPCELCYVACFSSFCCCCLSSKKSETFMQTVSSADLAKLAAMSEEGSLRPFLGLRLKGIDQIPDALADHFDTHHGGGDYANGSVLNSKLFSHHHSKF